MGLKDDLPNIAKRAWIARIDSPPSFDSMRASAADVPALLAMVEYLSDWAMTLAKHPAQGMEKDAAEHIEQLWASAQRK